MEVKQALKTHFALNSVVITSFTQIEPLHNYFGSEVCLAKFFLIPNEYLKEKYIVISLRDSFGAITRLKKSIHAKIKSF